MYSYDGEPLKVLGLDPHDPSSVVAWRKFLLDWDADLAVMAAIVAADQVRVRAKLAEMASVLDALDGTAEHAMHVQSVAAEVALIEQIGQSAAEGALSDAGIAVREFPGLVDALGEGKLSEEQLRVLTGAGLSVSHVDSDEQAARRGEFVRVMLAELGSRVLPPKALRMAAARVAESLTEESVSERYERARKTRYVSVTATENGMCLLRARLPLIEGTAIADRLRKQGKALIKARPKPASTKLARSGTSAGAAGRRGPFGAGADADADADADVDARADAHVDVDARADVAAADDPHVDAGAHADIDAAADPAVDAPDERTIDEVKADLFADMLLTSDPMSCAAAAGIQANVAFTIPILSALTAPGRNGAARGASAGASAVAGAGVSGPGGTGGVVAGASRASGATRLTPAPALLDGMVPVPLEEAMRLAANAPSFLRILTDPITGTVEAVDSYRPTAAMRNFLAARDIHCRWPGCRQPAARCDLDHTHAWEHGGTTTLENLCGLCKHHHVMKHATAWSVEELGGGILDWRTPRGKACTDRPEHHDVYFTPNDDYLTPGEPSPANRGTSPPAAEPPETRTADEPPF
ncbi:HNH endonuclease signature motif containing protein [Pseudoclavibacter terrae]|uniref:HNH endonuclease signature motif containing protein n=1 Tax=Pseudoclavibacter terrae TaxID=1530195 RepID=UPI00232CBB1C|nr:HNH endonuclease signature motif containing protein [Pseudoclavibacter terrae]